MNLQPGRRLAIAPNFQVHAAWPERLLLAAGTLHGEPRLPWRKPTDAELVLLILDEAAPRDCLRDCICLFQIPAHLRLAFWAILEQFGELPPDRAERFFSDVAEFLDFKQLPIPTRAACEVTAGKSGKPAAFVSSVGPPIWGAMNLDDEATAIAFVNLSADEMRTIALDSGPDMGLVERFLATCPDYPLVRLRLEPGEGYRLPAGGVPMSACTIDKDGPEVLLVIRFE